MTHTLRLVIVVLATLVSGLMLATPAAHAGTYTVRACEAGAGTGVNYLFGNTSGGAGAANPTCTYGYGLHTVIYGGALLWANGSLTFNAPAGTAVTNITLSNYTEWQGGGFARQIDDGVNNFYGGLLYDSFWVSTHGWDTPSLNTWTSSVRLISYCAANPQCTGNNANTRWSDIAIQLYNGSAPGFTHADGLWQNNGWVRGQQNIYLGASDDVGIKRLGVQRGADGGYAIYDEAYPGCDYHYAVPCGSSAGWRSVNLSSTPDGARGLRVFAIDAADNLAVADKTMYVDNTPPTATWSRSAGVYSKTARWTVTDASSGVKASSLQAQYSINGGATWSAMVNGALSGSTYTADLPATANNGTYMVRMTATDNATDWSGTGNATTTAWSQMAYDANAPEAPVDLAISPTTWSNNATFSLSWTNPVQSYAPIVAAHIERCSITTAVCSTTRVAGSDISSAAVVVPSYGEYEYRVWLEDSEGNASATNASAAVTARYGYAPIFSGTTSIDGDPQRGRTLTVDLASLSAVPSADLQYAWEREVNGVWQDIGEVSLTYIPTVADVGHRLRVRASASNELGSSESISTPTEPIAPSLDAESPAQLLDADRVGRTARYLSGEWTGAEPIAYGSVTFWSCSEPLALDASNQVQCEAVPGYIDTAVTEMPVDAELAGRYLAVTQPVGDRFGSDLIVARSTTPVMSLAEGAQVGKHLRVLSTSWSGSTLRIYARCYTQAPCVGQVTSDPAVSGSPSYTIPGASTRTITMSFADIMGDLRATSNILRLRGAEYLVTVRFARP